MSCLPEFSSNPILRNRHLTPHTALTWTVALILCSAGFANAAVNVEGKSTAAIASVSACNDVGNICSGLSGQTQHVAGFGSLTANASFSSPHGESGSTQSSATSQSIGDGVTLALQVTAQVTDAEPSLSTLR